MANLELYDYQCEAITKMRNGCILCGGVGSGKSRTALAYYYCKVCHGHMMINGKGSTMPMKDYLQLYIITTARKRDTYEWVQECYPFDRLATQVKVDSWNNIGKYVDVENAFFIFDEQRVVGSGKWVKSFLKIAKNNKWILLSATPGDCWLDYVPVFIANGYFKNRTEFMRKHVVFNRFSKFPQVDHYCECGPLIKMRNELLVDMNCLRQTVQHHEDVFVPHDPIKLKQLTKDRWDPYEDKPIEQASQLCYLMRRVCNEDPRRIEACYNLIVDRNDILRSHDRVIIFYNFDYELEALRVMCEQLKLECGYSYAEWNGHKHQMIPDTERWVYLVQYTAGAEGWNCTLTDTIIFYSQNYSYKIMIQSAGRIDRVNTQYKDLYYYHLLSRASIDIAIKKALGKKKDFNERKFIK